jgi:type III secretion system FlhB-like substrate exporter
MDWIRDVTNPQSFRFMWIYGPAGSGKSAIAQTIAEICEREGITIASFFFSRTVAERNNETSLISTLAYQIYLAIPEIRDFITEAVEHDPTIFSRSLDAQIRALMVEPLSFAPLQLTPKLILIDGLDECSSSKAQKCILQALAAAAAHLNHSVRFLVASRPEQAIRTSFNASSLSRMTKGLPLDETYKPNADIKMFLISRFSEITKDHPSGAFLPEIWPPEGTVDALVKKSSGQFIYASTVMKFIESHHHRPSDRLKIILGVSKSGNDAPFSELDAVYHHVLSNISPHNREKVIEVLAFLILTSSAPKSVVIDDKGVFYDYLPRTVERVLRYEPGDLYIYFLDMQSIVRVPEPSTLYVEELRFYHASFSDFLLDQSRSGEYFIDIGKAHAHLTICWRRYWEDWSGYLDRHQSIFIMRNLLHHCTQSTLTPTLLEELCTLDLNELLDNIHGVDVKGLVEWNSFYGWLKKQVRLAFFM